MSMLLLLALEGALLPGHLWPLTAPGLPSVVFVPPGDSPPWKSQSSRAIRPWWGHPGPHGAPTSPVCAPTAPSPLRLRSGRRAKVVLASGSLRSGQLHFRQVLQVAGLALCVAALWLRVQEVAQRVLLRNVGWLEKTRARAPRHCLGTLHLWGDTKANQPCSVPGHAVSCC